MTHRNAPPIVSEWMQRCASSEGQVGEVEDLIAEGDAIVTSLELGHMAVVGEQARLLFLQQRNSEAVRLLTAASRQQLASSRQHSLASSATRGFRLSPLPDGVPEASQLFGNPPDSLGDVFLLAALVDAGGLLIQHSYAECDVIVEGFYSYVDAQPRPPYDLTEFSKMVWAFWRDRQRAKTAWALGDAIDPETLETSYWRKRCTCGEKVDPPYGREPPGAA